MEVSRRDTTGREVTVEGLLDEYLAYLRSHRNLSDSSLCKHRRCARAFLAEIGATGRLCVAEALSVERVQSYVTDYAHSHGRGAVHAMLSTMRVLLRYLYIEGSLRRDLSIAVPSQHRRQLSDVPRSISEKAIEGLFRSLDRSQAIDKRDYAIFQILATYGVRGVQVRQLKLDDIRWAENQIVFRPAKGGKQIIQHLTAAVGNSLLDYVCHARPKNAHYDEVFLTGTVPPRPLLKAKELSAMVRRRLVNAGIQLPSGVSQGSHSFRHAFTNRMVCGAQPFKHVADMLGHKSFNSTMIYTKINLPALRRAAQEWPEVSS